MCGPFLRCTFPDFDLLRDRLGFLEALGTDGNLWSVETGTSPAAEVPLSGSGGALRAVLALLARRAAGGEMRAGALSSLAPASDLAADPRRKCIFPRAKSARRQVGSETPRCVPASWWHCSTALCGAYAVPSADDDWVPHGIPCVYLICTETVYSRRS